jgi:hypothetical protein
MAQLVNGNGCFDATAGNYITFTTLPWRKSEEGAARRSDKSDFQEIMSYNLVRRAFGAAQSNVTAL